MASFLATYQWGHPNGHLEAEQRLRASNARRRCHRDAGKCKRWIYPRDKEAIRERFDIVDGRHRGPLSFARSHKVFSMRHGRLSPRAKRRKATRTMGQKNRNVTIRHSCKQWLYKSAAMNLRPRIGYQHFQRRLQHSSLLCSTRQPYRCHQTFNRKGSTDGTRKVGLRQTKKRLCTLFPFITWMMPTTPPPWSSSSQLLTGLHV